MSPTRYTAQELRDQAARYADFNSDSSDPGTSEMLQQAADTEEALGLLDNFVGTLPNREFVRAKLRELGLERGR